MDKTNIEKLIIELDNSIFSHRLDPDEVFILNSLIYIHRKEINKSLEDKLNSYRIKNTQNVDSTMKLVTDGYFYVGLGWLEGSSLVRAVSEGNTHIPIVRKADVLVLNVERKLSELKNKQIIDIKVGYGGKKWFKLNLSDKQMDRIRNNYWKMKKDKTGFLEI